MPDLLVQMEGFNIGKEKRKKSNMPKLMPSVTLWTFSNLATFGVFLQIQLVTYACLCSLCDLLLQLCLK